MADQALYRVSSQMEVAKHVQLLFEISSVNSVSLLCLSSNNYDKNVILLALSKVQEQIKQTISSEITRQHLGQTMTGTLSTLM